MNIKNIVCVALAGIALSACAWLHEQFLGGARHGSIRNLFYDEPLCEKSPCKVVVTVEGCRIEVAPERLGVRHGLRDTEIVWELESPGYSFPERGITFQDKEMTKPVFHQARRVEPNRFTIIDANAGPGKYKYNVRVMKGEKACPPYDPYIVNDM